MQPDYRQYTDAQVDAAVRLALGEVDLPPSYGISIRSLVKSLAQNWRQCCGGNCSPCIGRIEEAVDRARELLRKGEIPDRAEPVTSLHPHPEPVATSPVTATEASDDDEAPDRNWGLDYA